MDTSIIYTMMCDSKELKKESEGKWDGTCIIWLNDRVFMDTQGNYWTHYLNTEIATWLPRQDQIQKMFKTAPFVLAGDFNKKMENYITGNPDNWSFEMLWLAFYMYDKHKKIWNGKGWAHT